MIDRNKMYHLFRRGVSSAARFPAEVSIVEVGPRDGLQNEELNIPTENKIEFVDKLSQSGLQRIEVTSFVSAKWVPQLADAKEVMKKISRNPNVRYSTLTPNLKGLNDALDSNTQEIAIFGAASETFTKKNINCTIEQSLKQFDQVVQQANANKLPIRGYVSCVVGCPYEGFIKPKIVGQVVEKMLSMGCYEVSLGDTIGVGNPNTVRDLLTELKRVVSGNMDLLAIHCHDTYGMALVNIVEALESGIRVVDSSTAGLGGCPYASKGGAAVSGNVATEDVLYLLNSLGVRTGVDMNTILAASDIITSVLNRKTNSKVGLALGCKKN
ncbi:hydroxymethylglutaryl- mitochondrial [Brachionus plicatilis]|uniref:hydroxymethylglutaryl-CoA lyase n=1 Tax=Brachionus plicatilis TaxID=10195 RepID=A0A3M7RNN6_BRAPC|nr:hydroxymethylglutaryl- mitochondrial [Brachionus plicatilis]